MRGENIWYLCYRAKNPCEQTTIKTNAEKSWGLGYFFIASPKGYIHPELRRLRIGRILHVIHPCPFRAASETVAKVAGSKVVRS